MRSVSIVRAAVAVALVGAGLVVSHATLAGAAGASLCDAVTGNIVTNCGFEQTNRNVTLIPGWTATGSVSSSPSQPNSGSGIAFMGAGGLSQTLSATVAGTTYDVSFYAKGPVGSPPSLSVSDSGPVVLTTGPVLTNFYRLFTGTFTAGSGEAPTITITYSNTTGGALRLDDVVITPRASVAVTGSPVYLKGTGDPCTTADTTAAELSSPLTVTISGYAGSKTFSVSAGQIVGGHQPTVTTVTGSAPQTITIPTGGFAGSTGFVCGDATSGTTPSLPITVMTDTYLIATTAALSNVD